MVITHYYHKDDEPFKTLSSLPKKEALNVIDNLRNRNGSVYRRFSDPDKYLQQRYETENWLRDEFIKKGGQPSIKYPQYCVVGRSTWIEDGYHGEYKMIQMPISNFSSNQISFTYPDSMLSYWLQSQTNKIYYNPKYHGHVFILDEIYQIIEQFDIPLEEWKVEGARKYDIFIEAQVWKNSSIISHN